ncbi:MAG: CoA-binding protein [Planctomycetaceae bacterium]
MARPTVAILGASRDRQKYGNKSVRAHRAQGYDVYPINPREEEIEGLKVYPSLAAAPAGHLNRISVYLSPEIGIGLLEEIKARRADEVWFNPGSESPELLARAAALGLEVIQACSIVDVGMSPSQL